MQECKSAEHNIHAIDTPGLTYRIDISIKIPDARNMKRKGCVNIKQGQLDQAITLRQVLNSNSATGVGLFVYIFYVCILNV